MNTFNVSNQAYELFQTPNVGEENAITCGFYLPEGTKLDVVLAMVQKHLGELYMTFDAGTDNKKIVRMYDYNILDWYDFSKGAERTECRITIRRPDIQTQTENIKSKVTELEKAITDLQTRVTALEGK